MTTPGAPPPGFIWPVVTQADIETVALYFLTPLLAPTPVATRLPNDTVKSDTINGFLRVEAGGGTKINLVEYNQTIILHSYVPDEFEVQGVDIGQKALAYMGAVGGQTIGGYYISCVPRVTVLQRRTDPRVNLLRYLGMVTWTVKGNPVAAQ